MTIQIDSREKARAIQKILAEFDKQGVKHFVSKLHTGDYMNLDNPRLGIDRKKDLQEVIGDVTQQHERFRTELIRAEEQGIRIVLLIEQSGIHTLEDVYFWHNPRLDLTEIRIIDGRPQLVQKFPKATTGESLYRCLFPIRQRYGVEYYFCSKHSTGKRIAELLGGDASG